MPGDVRRDRLELAAELGRGVGLEVVHVDVARPAGLPDQDDRLSCAARPARRRGLRSCHAARPARRQRQVRRDKSRETARQSQDASSMTSVRDLECNDSRPLVRTDRSIARVPTM